MARLKVGGFFVDASGKLGGHQISRNSGQLVLSNKSVGNKKPSVLQSNQRVQTQFIMASWQFLTDSQRLLWSEKAKTYTRRDKFYDKRPINGFQLFNIVNQNRLQLGLSLLTTPAIHDVPNPPQVITVTATSTEIIITSDSYGSNTIIIIYATPLLSRGITNPRKLLRSLTSVTPAQLATGYDLYADYTDKYGPISDGDNFFIGIKTISNVSYYSPKGITINRPIVVVSGTPPPTPKIDFIQDARFGFSFSSSLTTVVTLVDITPGSTILINSVQEDRTTTCSDDIVGSYTPTTPQKTPSSAGMTNSSFYFTNHPGGTATITITYGSSANYRAMWATEWQGVDNVNPIEAVGVSIADGSGLTGIDKLINVDVDVTSINAMLVNFVGDTNSDDPGLNLGTGYSGNKTSNEFLGEYKEISTPSTVTPAFTNGNNDKRTFTSIVLKPS